MNAEIPPAERSMLLNSSDHSRDSAGMRYVYPVVSRRAGGVSIGINLNPNNACNWRCIYCQVPNLTRGSAPEIDLALLEVELRQMLHELLHGDFLTTRVPEGARRIEDIAFSGNGEPTSAKQFYPAVELVVRIVRELELAESIKLRLITNGSLVDRPEVQRGLELLGQAKGEAWFKLDAGTRLGIKRLNGVDVEPAAVAGRLLECASRCTTWVQSCCFAVDGIAPSEAEILAWLDLLGKVRTRLAGVHLYGLARPSLQTEAPRLGRLPREWLGKLGERVEQMGLTAKISP